ncbi:putative kinase-like protein TMKL1 [Capsicum baccatum]|uniref:Kinase-like protein TMKL1 n=1 Tax=Capsicum baccatum TaxID=33114 RepID=A0A2G2VZD2_CAPBA|nr:putative kinase-like protein TMKL1 [Capsicum baccatum]
MIPAVADDIISVVKAEAYKVAELERLKKCNLRTDVYAFNILLLEILLDKNGRNGDNVDLPALVKVVVLEEITLEVFAMELLKGIMNPMEEGLVQSLRLEMGCCAPVATVRPSMDEVVRQLEENRPRNLSALYNPTETRSGSGIPF